MALTVPSGVDKIYGGEAVGLFAGKLFNEHELYKARKIFVRESFTDKITVPVSDSTFNVQDYAATPSSTGNAFTLSDRTMQLEKYNLYFEWNPLETMTYWKQYQPTGELVFAELPAALQAQMLSEAFASEGEYHAKADYIGNKTSGVAPFNKYDGILQLVKNGAGRYAQAIRKDYAPVGNNGTSGFTESSIKAILDAEVASIIASGDSQIAKAYYKADFFWTMSPRTFQIYSNEQKAQSNKGVDFTQTGVQLHNGKAILVDPNFPDFHIMGTYGSDNASSNLQLGINSLASQQTFLTGRVANNSDNHFFKLTLTRALMVVRPEHLILIY
jgi:hypothetical protein